MKEYIIAISDDMDIFESLYEAEKYFEPWILESKYNCRAFDQNGNILNASVQQGERIKLINSGVCRADILKDLILDYIPRLGLVNLVALRTLSVSQLVDYLVKVKGITS